MKNNNALILLLAVVVIAVVIIAMKGKGGEESTAGVSDYDKIETVRQAVEQVAGTAANCQHNSQIYKWKIGTLTTEETLILYGFLV